MVSSFTSIWLGNLPHDPEKLIQAEKDLATVLAKACADLGEPVDAKDLSFRFHTKLVRIDSCAAHCIPCFSLHIRSYHNVKVKVSGSNFNCIWVRDKPLDSALAHQSIREPQLLLFYITLALEKLSTRIGENDRQHAASP